MGRNEVTLVVDANEHAIKCKLLRDPKKIGLVKLHAKKFSKASLSSHK